MKITARSAEREGSRFHFSHSLTIIGLHFARNKTTHTQLANSITRKKKLKLQTLHNNLKDDFPKLKKKLSFRFSIPSGSLAKKNLD